ncbi:MAG: ABC transporter substrate-binding protein, partial [Caldilineaceae bacterium]|nr:ABC transporter substrate-binding protein [Caldilineaceae bacterium]
LVNSTDVNLSFLLYNNLIRRSEGEAGAPLYPELADAWEMNEDATVYTFYLHQGVFFQHGTPFTAKDVEYSINRLIDPNFICTVGPALGVIDRLEVADEYTIKIYLKEPNVALPYMLSEAGMQIVPHDRTTEELTKEPAGTGPFVLAERIPGERIVVKRNENYWAEGQPYLDEVHLVVMPEMAAKVAALSSGEIDILQQVGYDMLPALESSADVTIVESLQSIYPIFAMHVTEAPFDDLRVRQAFKHAIDRVALHNTIMQGRGAIGNDQPIGPGSPYWADVQPLAYDVEKAKQLLNEAGYPNGIEVTLAAADTGGPRVTDAAFAIQEMVNAAGITMIVEKIPASTFYADKFMKAPFFTSWWPAYSEPDGILPLSYATHGIYNLSEWSTPQVNELVTTGREELDTEKRKAVYAEAQAIISAEGGVIIPYFAPYLQAVRSNLRGHIPASRIVYQQLWFA